MIKSTTNFNVIVHDVPEQVNAMIEYCKPPKAKYVSGRLQWENIVLAFFDDAESLVLDTFMSRLTPLKHDQQPLHITIEYKEQKNRTVVSELNVLGCLIEKIELSEIDKRGDNSGWERTKVTIELSYLSVNNKKPK